MFGEQYIADHINFFAKEETEKKALIIYITDGIKAIAENTAKQVGGTALSIRFASVLEPPKAPANAEEIKERMIKKMERFNK